MKPAIILSDPSSITETFIRRHISSLNNGDSAVVSCVSSGQEENINYFLLQRSFCQKIFYKVFSSILHVYPPIDLTISGLFFRRLLSFLSSRKVDYLLFEFGTLAVDNYDLALHSGYPYAIYFRGYDASMMLNSRYYRKRLAKLVKSSSCIFAVSPHLLENLNCLNISHPRSFVVPSSVERQPYIPWSDKDSHLFVSIGRLVEKKQHLDTLKAFSIFIKSLYRPKVRLLILGDGPLRVPLQDFCRSNGISRFVSFLGSVSHEEVFSYLRQASLYIQSSAQALNLDAEGFPSAIQEAMMSSCLILSTKHGGVNHFLRHNTDSLLCDERSPSQMASNIQRVYANPSFAAKIAKNGYHNAIHNMDIKVNACKIDAIIAKSVETPRVYSA